MTKKFPIGLSTLEKIRTGNFYYVDKTYLVEQLVKKGQYYFLSRPRRFGKSLLLDTIKQAFLGKKEIFKGLYLEHHWNWDQQYPVIHIAFTSNQVSDTATTLTQKIVDLLQTIATEYGVTLRGELYSSQFSFLIQDIAQQHPQKKVIILVDEYDKPILDEILDPAITTKNRDILRGFYSVIKEHDDKIQFSFLTGVSKFSKTGVFSGLNNVDDITYDQQYGTICGYTQAELEEIFHDCLEPKDLPKIKQWYNGYYFLGDEGVYNPFSILNYLAKGKIFSNYWFASGTPTFLVELFKQRKFYLPQMEYIEIFEDEVQGFDIDRLPLLPLLLQTGYLTIAGVKQQGFRRKYILTYPNLEVRMSLNDILSKMWVTDEVKNDTSEGINQALVHHQFERIKDVLTSLFASIPHDWYRNNDIQHYEGFYCATVYTYLMGLGYQAIAEDVTSQGQIDITVILDDRIVILEFKLSTKADAQSAVQQIKDRRYADKYRARQKPIYLVGLSFDPEQRAVSECLFECVDGIL